MTSLSPEQAAVFKALECWLIVHSERTPQHDTLVRSIAALLASEKPKEPDGPGVTCSAILDDILYARVCEIAKDVTYPKIEGLVERAETLEKKMLDITGSLHNAIDRVENRISALERPAPAQPAKEAGKLEFGEDWFDRYAGRFAGRAISMNREQFARAARAIRLEALAEAVGQIVYDPEADVSNFNRGVRAKNVAIQRLIDEEKQEQTR